MISFISETCLTVGEENIKSESPSHQIADTAHLKRRTQYDSHSASTIVAYVVTLDQLSHTVQFNLLCVTRVKDSVT